MTDAYAVRGMNISSGTARVHLCEMYSNTVTKRMAMTTRMTTITDLLLFVSGGLSGAGSIGAAEAPWTKSEKQKMAIYPNLGMSNTCKRAVQGVIVERM
jgi:hypothetical protein